MKRILLLLLALIPGMIFARWDVSSLGAQEPDQAEFTLEEITVTAEKREENVQAVPRSMAVITADDLTLRQSTNVQDMLNAASGITFQGFFNQVAIRGVGIGGAQVNDPGYEPSVQFNVDGNVAFTAAGGTATMFQAMTDMERVEVIRGPSGAINGRMAAAGTINIVTKDPDFEEIDFNGGVTYGDYGTMNANAALNLPLKLTGLDLPGTLENLSFRIAASRQHHDEYIHNQDDQGVSGSQDVKLGRIKMKWQPIENLTLNALYSVTKDKSNPEMRVPPINTKQTFPPFPGEPHPDDPWLYYNGQAAGERAETEDYTESFEAVYSASFATFTGKWSHSWRPQKCQPGQPNCTEGDIGQKDFELRLASPDESRIKWMVGWYKYHKKEYAGPDQEVTEINDETEVNIGFNSLYGDASWYTGMGYDTSDPDFDPNDPDRPWAIPGVPSITADSVFFYSNDATRPIDSYSYFGNITIPFFEDRHRFTFGLRKSVEEKKRAAVYAVYKFDEDNTNNGLPHFKFVYNTFGDTSKGTWVVDNYYLEYVEEPQIMQTTDKPLDITAGWEYDWKPDVMVYFNVNSGFKPGGISSEGVPNTYYEPETNITYAAGVKSRLFGNTLVINFEAYVMDYDNLQLDTNSSSSVSFTAGNGITYTQAYMFNKKIVNVGKTRNYGLTVDYDWLITGSDRLKGNFEIKNNKYGELRFDLGTNAMPPGNPQWFVLTGRQMPFAPKFAFYGSYSHMFTFGNYILTPRADIRYSTKYPLFSEWYWELAGVETMQPAYFKYDGYLNFGPTSGAWQIDAYVKNISNEVVRDLGMMYTTVQPPRTMGVGLSFKF